MQSSEAEDTIDPRTEKTKEALVAAAIKLFGQKGFDVTTMRELAKESGTNIAAINYHFGSKDELRRAATRHIAQQLQERGPGPLLEGLTNASIAVMEQTAAASVLRKVMASTLIDLADENGSADIQRFFRRELYSEGFDLELFFDLVFTKHFHLMKHLVARVTGLQMDTEECRVKTLTLMGQAMFLGMAQSLVLKAIGWTEFGRGEVDKIADAFWIAPDHSHSDEERFS